LPGRLLEKGRTKILECRGVAEKTVYGKSARDKIGTLLFSMPQWAKLSKFNIAQRGRKVLSISFLTYNSINSKITRGWLWQHGPK
jgi:hypothetical protein